MEYLQSLLDDSKMPFLTAFVLGLLTSLSPCPLATNITAVGFISKDISDNHKIFRNGILYTIGRILTYTILGIVLISAIRKGTDIFAVQKNVSRLSEVILSPSLIIIGLFMAWGKKLRIPIFTFSPFRKTVNMKGAWGSLFIGILFAMTFCPTSGMLFFGMLIPMSAIESEGYLLPAVFALATGIPVVLVAWILAYSVSGIGKFYNCMVTLQRWLNVIVSVAFILLGVYYGLCNYGIL